MKKPFFTIIIPTRDRPNMVDINLFFMSKQDYGNFEVIISDNCIEEGCKDIVDKYDERFLYLKPEKPLSMSENWEYALNRAKGQYICFLQDKMFFYVDSLGYLHDFIVANNDADIIDWDWDFFSFDKEGEKLSGKLLKKNTRDGYYNINCREEIEKKLSFEYANSYQNEGGTPGPGKILAACFKKELIEKIVNKYGDYFSFLTPDYGPNIRTLLNADKVLKINKNLSVAIPSKTSFGLACSKKQKPLFDFIKENKNGEKIINFAVVKNMTSSTTNMITAEYNYTIETIGVFFDLKKKVNAENALRFIIEEYRSIEYENELEKESDRKKIEKVMQDNNIVYVKHSNEKKFWWKYICGIVKNIIKKIIPKYFINKIRKQSYCDLKINNLKEDYKKMIM